MNHVANRFLVVVLMATASFFYGPSVAQQVGVSINSTGAQADDDAILDLGGTDKGVFLPRLTTVQRLALTPDNPGDYGLTVYDRTTKSFWYWDGTQWVEITSATSGGNTLDQAYDEGGSGAGRIIVADAGAVDIQDAGGLLVAGNVGIGTTSPNAQLNVGGATGAEIYLTREDVTTLTNDVLGSLLFDSTDDTNPSSNDASAVIRGHAAEEHGNSDKGGYLTFWTKAINTLGTAAATERMRISASGDVYIGASTGANNDIYISDDIIDWDDQSYFVDPGAENRINEIEFDDGSAGDPSVWFEADDNSGLFQPANGTIGWTINGTEAMRLNSSRNLGIGTTAPGQKLEVSGTARLSSLAGSGNRMVYSDNDGDLVISSSAIDPNSLVDGTGGPDRVSYWADANTLTSSSEFLYSTSGNLSVYNPETTTAEVRLGAAWNRPGVYSSRELQLFSDATGIIFGDSDTERMRMTAAGNLGIGTNGTAQKLEVAGTARLTDLGGSGNRMVFADNDGDLTISSSNIDPNSLVDGAGTLNYLARWTPDANTLGTGVTFDNGTNVGIGTDNPGQKLQVNGIARSYGSYVLDMDGANGSGPRATFGTTSDADAFMTIGAYNSINNVETTNRNFRIGSSSVTNAFYILQADGNVGIGTAGPDRKLRVEGNIYANTTLEAAANNTWYLRGGDDHELRDVNEANTLGLWGRQNSATARIKLGSGNNVIRSTDDQTGDYGSAATFDFDDATGSQAIVIEGGVEESGGVFVNGNTAAIWSPGDGTGGILSVYDEDDMDINDPRMRLDGDGDLGIGIGNPDDKLDVVGTGHISSYLKVGNPSAPSGSLSSGSTALFGWSSNEGYNGWSTSSVCGSSSADWYYTYGTDPSYTNRLVYNNIGGYTRKLLYSPWIWVPTGGTSVLIEPQYWCSLENNYDGVFLEYSTNGSTWTKVTSWLIDGYPDAASGSNTSCNGTNSQTCWNGISDYVSDFGGPLSVAGNWVRFRFVGMEDIGDATGVFELYGFSLSCSLPGTIGGSFAAGNIYAENNVYAGSNVLLGDIAEYFDVKGVSQPGDLVSIDPKAADAYQVTHRKNDSHILGVHSTNPTVTLNSPDAGVPVALRGRVPVNVTTEGGAIHPGDLLTSSSTKGHAMKANGKTYVVGRALEYFDGDAGQILCLLENGWYNPTSGNVLSSGNFETIVGRSEVTVHDKSVSASSKVFLTMLGDPGSRYWISKKGDERFTIEFASEVSEAVSFDYMVESPKEIEEESKDERGWEDVCSIPGDADPELIAQLDMSVWKYSPEKTNTGNRRNEPSQKASKDKRCRK